MSQAIAVPPPTARVSTSMHGFHHAAGFFLAYFECPRLVLDYTFSSTPTTLDCIGTSLFAAL
jgi:hypothetical protein